MTGALWYAAMSDVKFLNESLDKLADLKVAGYSLEIVDRDERFVTLALAGSGPGGYLTLSLFAIGWMESSAKAWKLFFALKTIRKLDSKRRRLLLEFVFPF